MELREERVLERDLGFLLQRVVRLGVVVLAKVLQAESDRLPLSVLNTQRVSQ